MKGGKSSAPFSLYKFIEGFFFRYSSLRRLIISVLTTGLTRIGIVTIKKFFDDALEKPAVRFAGRDVFFRIALVFLGSFWVVELLFESPIWRVISLLQP